MPPHNRSRQDIINAIVQDVDSRRPVASPETQEVARSVNRNAIRLGMEPGQEQGDGGVLGAGLSVLGRTFDVLSRPLYATANVAENYFNEGPTSLTRPFGQIWQGLSGQQKVTGHDVLDAAGVEGSVARGAGGFALDVLLDPLTYTGLGLVRGASKQAIEAAGGKAFSNVLSEGARVGSPLSRAARTEGRKAGRVAQLDALSRYRREGFSMAEVNAGAQSEARRVGDEVAEDWIRTAAEEKALQAVLAAKDNSAGRLAFKVMGKEVGGSQAIYRVGSRAATWLSSTRTGNAINKAFRPQATFVSGLNQEKRIVEAVGMANMERWGHTIARGGEIDDIAFPPLKGLTDDEASEILHAVESSNPYQGGFQREYEASKALIHKIGINEQGTSIDVTKPLLDGELIDNYVHQSFDMAVDNPVEVAEWNRLRKREINSVISKAKATAEKRMDSWLTAQKTLGNEVTEEQARIQFRTFFDEIPKVTTFTTRRALDEGLHPITDIRHALGNHVQSHFRKNGRIKFLEGAIREFGADLGSSPGVATLARKMGLVRVTNKLAPDNIYVPKEIGYALSHIDDVFYLDDAAGGALRDLYDNALGYLKFGQTVINPGHHVRNAMSDISLNQLDGVVDPTVYRDSMSILRALKKSDHEVRTSILADADDAFQDMATVLDDLSFDVGKTQLSGRQIWDHFVEAGGKAGFYRSEITVGNTGFMAKIREVAEVREDWTRLAHFIDAVKKEGSKLNPRSKSYIADLQAATKAAGARVRKYNIDYGDLTPFEQRTMKRVIPFYTWMRKNIPLQIEGLFMRPGRQMVTPKAIRALQVALGQGPEDTDILGLNSLPDYMRHAMQVNLMGEGEGRNGVYWNPGSLFPVMDLNEFFGQGTPRDLAERQLSGLTPFAQIPIQQVTGYNFYSGRPSSKGILQNLIESTPYGRFGYGVTQGDQPVADTRLINLFTGLGLTRLNDNMQRGELRRQEDIVQQLLRERQGA